MIQIRIHGRGGQGVVTAAELIAIAAFYDGKEAQAFPSFGVERTGAPVESYARISDQPIRLREQIYQPDIIIVQDATLIGTVDILKGASAKTLVVVNTSQPKESLGLKTDIKNVFTIDATKISLDVIGKNIVNTVILGAVAKATGIVTLPSLEKSVRQKFADKSEEIIKKNIAAVKKAYDLEGESKN